MQELTDFSRQSIIQCGCPSSIVPDPQSNTLFNLSKIVVLTGIGGSIGLPYGLQKAIIGAGLGLSFGVVLSI